MQRVLDQTYHLQLMNMAFLLVLNYGAAEIKTWSLSMYLFKVPSPLPSWYGTASLHACQANEFCGGLMLYRSLKLAIFTFADVTALTLPKCALAKRVLQHQPMLVNAMVNVVKQRASMAGQIVIKTCSIWPQQIDPNVWQSLFWAWKEHSICVNSACCKRIKNTYLFCWLLTMADVRFWSIKNKSDKQNPSAMLANTANGSNFHIGAISITLAVLL